MSVSVLITRATIAMALVVGLATTNFAAITLKLNPGNLERQGPGVLDVGVLLNWDGTGTNLISGFNFDVVVPTNVTLLNTDPVTNPISNPLGFLFANVADRSAAFGNFPGDVAPLPTGDTQLTSLRFNVNAAMGDFPIGLRLVNVQSGPNFTDITNQVTAFDAVLRVTAVPEPSSFAAVGLVALGVLGRRRRR